jgi:HAE1 family hydrophobic/amphiphilic exporter-1
MTALATIFALIPMALGITGEGGFISRPLAIVVIGGLVTSTLLTLVLVPTLYTMVEGAKERWRQRRSAAPAAEPVLDAPAGPGERPVSDGDPGTESVPDTDGGPGHDAAAGDADPDRGADGQPAEPRPSALVAPTDQFEVLRLPKTTRSPLHPSE